MRPAAAVLQQPLAWHGTLAGLHPVILSVTASLREHVCAKEAQNPTKSRVGLATCPRPLNRSRKRATVFEVPSVTISRVFRTLMSNNARLPR